MLNRSYARITIQSKIVRVPLEDFPNFCPNCKHPWLVQASWMSFGLKDIGREAQCRRCSCHMLELIDVEQQLSHSESSAQFLDTTSSSQHEN
jgi:hypothetical protein